MRRLAPTEQKLLVSCQAFKSEQELKKLAPHKYTILKHKNLLNILFPVHTCKLPSDYIPPYKLENCKEQSSKTFKEIEKLVQQGHKDTLNAQTVQEVNKIYTKVVNNIKGLIGTNKTY